MTTRICTTAAFVVDASAADRASVCQALGRLADVVLEIADSHAGLHLEGSVGAGDLTWDFSIEDQRGLDALERRLERDGWAGLFADGERDDQPGFDLLTEIEAWRIEPLAANVPSRDLAAVKRTNLVRVFDSASSDTVARWSREVVQLADFVPAIRNWSLARTFAFGPSSPRVEWTHAWEQEFEMLDGLVSDYMASPYHWGWLDGWYDPEVPFCIIEPDLAHLYCEATQNVLAWNNSKPGQEDSQ